LESLKEKREIKEILEVRVILEVRETMVYLLTKYIENMEEALQKKNG